MLSYNEMFQTDFSKIEPMQSNIVKFSDDGVVLSVSYSGDSHELSKNAISRVFRNQFIDGANIKRNNNIYHVELVDVIINTNNNKFSVELKFV